ncbi:response regulator [Hymenobacter sp. CRA2]|uniref:response regulator n=1 Tax=Hymenobacter sp. CRA2 TaxID=1955620 RepID=UPI00098F403E|nr:response regulator [Hymenobacter sp. CRA2]OON67564.1 response regulator [Hymenobacter sp. CRA2]
MPKLSRILLVDDDQTTNYLNQLLLKRLDVAEQLQVALNGQEALNLMQDYGETAATPQPMLVLLDVKMPVMDGFEFLQAYAELPVSHREDVVIVMLTTSLHPQDVERVQQLNIAGFLNKPLTSEKINDILQQYFH